MKRHALQEPLSEYDGTPSGQRYLEDDVPVGPELDERREAEVERCLHQEERQPALCAVRHLLGFRVFGCRV